MEFSFIISSEAMALLKKNKVFLYPNVTYDTNQSSVTLESPKPNKSTLGQFMSEIKRLGILIGKKEGKLITLDSNYIKKYPYELEKF